MLPAVWDYIVVGGGLAGTVITSRMHEYNTSLNILLIEAGQDTRNRTDILYPNATLMGTELDWQFQTEPDEALNGRSFTFNQGKALGGGAIINPAGWTRGSAHDFEEWAEFVGDDRWDYEHQLPYMKMTENWFDNKNPSVHGQDGPITVSSVSSTGRKYPLRGPLADGWDALGVKVLPHYDGNTGDNLGRSELNEARNRGKRQVPPVRYPLDGVTVLTETLVEKILLNTKDNGGLEATGVQLANGTQYSAKNVISCSGAYGSPKLLMLSGIGDAEELGEHGIDVKLDLPEVGKNLGDHISVYQYWRLKNPEKGYAIGSSNPIFQKEQYGWGWPVDWVVVTAVDKEQLAEALEKDDGVAPDASHPLLRNARSVLEYFIMYQAVSPANPEIPLDGSHLNSDIVHLLPTSRGTVGLRSADPQDSPVINLNYLDTEVDRVVAREGLRELARVMLDTKFGKHYIAGETPPDGFEPITVDASDEYLDARLAAAATTTWHPHGACSMGRVVDSKFKVMGVDGLFVADSSVIPVALAAHLMAPVYAMAEQAAAIFAGEA